MDSPGGTSSGSTGLMDQQKKKQRMLSNRESARRSRQRKQKHLDDLSVQVAQLRKEKGHILAAVAVTNHNLMAVDAENSVLRTQMAELSTRLRSLNDILFYMNISSEGSIDVFFSEPWNQPPLSIDMFQYC